MRQTDDKAFISYSRRDKPFVRRLFEALQATGRNIWVDWESIPYSADWWKEISQGIEAADTFILIISHASMTSEICNREITRARELNKRIVPVIRQNIDTTYVTEYWSKQDWQRAALDNWDYLKKLNWLFFRKKDLPECQCSAEILAQADQDGQTPHCDSPACDYDNFDDSFQKLVKTVETDLNHVRLHTRLLTRALEWEYNNRNNSFAVRGSDLQSAEIWLASSIGKEPAPTPIHSEYILASRKASNRRQQITLGSVILALAITLVLLVFAVYQSQIADQNAAIANANAVTATFARGLAQFNAATAVSNASTATVAQGQAQDNAATANVAQIEALNNAATSDANEATAIIAQGQAQDNAATAFAAAATSDRRADEAQSLFWANSAQQALNGDDAVLALPLAIAANEIASPPSQSQRVLVNAAFAPSARALIDTSLFSGALGSILLTPDNQKIIFGLNDGTVHVWDIRTQTIIQTFNGHTESISGLALSPNGTQLATASWDKTVIIYDFETGEILHRIPAHKDLVLSVAFSPDGKQLVSTGYDLDPTLKLWDVATATLIKTFEGHESGVNDAIFTPDGKTLISCADDGTIRFWDIASGEARTLNAHPSRIWAMDLSPDGKTLLSGGADGGIILWDLNTYKALRTYRWSSIAITSVALHPDGQHAVMVSLIGRPLVWDLETGETVEEFPDPIGNGFNEGHGAIISKDGRMLLSSKGNYVILWDLTDGQPSHVFGQQGQTIKQLAFTPDGKRFISTSSDNTQIVWDSATGSQVARFSGNEAGYESLSDIALLGDNHSAISLADGTTLVEWDLDTGKEVRRFADVAEYIRDIAAIPGTNHLVIAPADELPVIWDVDTGKTLLTFTADRIYDDFYSVVVTPDGKQAIAKNLFSDLFLWDIESGVLIQQLDVPSRVNLQSDILSLTLNQDGKNLLIGYIDNSVALLDAETGHMLSNLQAEQQYMTAVAITPDGRYAVGGSSDGLTVWDLTTGEIIRSIKTSSGITALAIDHNGRGIIAGQENGTVGYWTIIDPTQSYIDWAHQNRYVRELSCAERQQYAFSPQCDEFSRFPTSTPYTVVATPTLMPSPTAIQPLLVHTSPDEAIEWLKSEGAISDPAGFLSGEISDETTIDLSGINSQYSWKLFDGVYDNFILSTTIQWGPGAREDTCGFVLRGNSDGYYLIQINREGKLLFDEQADDYWLEQRAGYSAAVNAGRYQTNHLLVVVRDSQYMVYLNGQYADTFVDSTLEMGSVGIVAGTYDASEETHCTFSDSWLWSLRSTPLVTPTLAPTATEAPIAINEINIGEPKANNTYTSGVTQAWTFTAEAGQILTMSVVTNEIFVGPPYPNDALYLISVNGELLATAGADDHDDLVIGPMEMPYTGPYSVLVHLTSETADGYDISIAQRSAPTDRTNIGTVGYIEPGEEVSGVVQPTTLYYWTFEAEKGQQITLDMVAKSEGLDPYLFIYDGNFNVIAENDDYDGSNSHIGPIEMPRAGLYFVGAAAFNGTSGNYTLKYSAVLPPTSTPIPQTEAKSGSNKGQIPIGGAEIWTYPGQSGQVLTLRVSADKPANDASDRTGLFDTWLIVYSPDGSILASSDDIQDGVVTDSLIEDLELPSNGIYHFEIRSYGNDTGGAYTLTVEAKS